MSSGTTAFRITEGIERSLVRQRLDSQGQFIALINALDMQLESGDPDPTVVHLLGDALLALADARGLDRKRLKLDSHLTTLHKRLDAGLSS